jgi:tRNA U34 2-thiouridine synthase MnmA/TrmU
VLYGGIDSLGAMMATTKKCESIQAVIMQIKRSEKAEKKNKRTDQIESTQ